MSQSIQSRIMAAVVVAIGTSGISTYRCRMSAFNKAELPANNVLPEDGTTQYLDSDSIDRTYRFKVRHLQMAVDEVDAAVDAQYVSAQKALFADTTLGGLAIVVREIEQKWEIESGEYDSVALVVLYEAEFQTSRSDPSVNLQ